MIQKDSFLASYNFISLRPRSNEKNISNLTSRELQDDGISYSHSTSTAAKAVGQTYGSAKEATLVVVKLASLQKRELETVFDAIWQDIKTQPLRQKRSIVTIS